LDDPAGHGDGMARLGERRMAFTKRLRPASVKTGETGTADPPPQGRGSKHVTKTSVLSRRSTSGWYRAELAPPAELDFAIRELLARCKRLERNPENDELHNQCGAKVEHLKHLTESLDLDDEIREAARNQLAETERWLDAMPVGRRNRLISPHYSDTW
jgi:hypothetical protein